jgi:cation:H+ antiporter
MVLNVLIFILAITFLVLGADFFLKSAEKIGLAFGLSPFIVGVTIVAFGTSFPELFTAMTAAFMDVTEMIPANAIGSNIANILLVVGFSAVVGGKLVITKNLIDIDLPLLAIGTVILIGVVFPWGEKDTAVISRPESIILLVTYVFYLLYTFLHKDDTTEQEKIPTRKERRKHIILENKEKKERPKVDIRDWALLLISGIVLAFSAKYLVSSVVSISELLGIGVGVISILAVAVGTSLPELVVSVKAAMKGKPEVALGNVFGSNVFNSFIVIGLPGIFREIHIDEQTLSIGFPIMVLATLLFVISGISRRIHNWEGIFFITLYIIFTGKIIGLF